MREILSAPWGLAGFLFKWTAAVVAGGLLAGSPLASADDTGLTGNRDLRPAAERGDPVAQFQLGKRYYSESCRIPVRDAEALKWFRLSAAQGNAQAEERLGHVYFTGRCEPQDFAEAAKWYRKAAENGDKRAQLRLAEIYRDGKGVPADLEQAKKWNDLATQCRTATNCFPSAALTDGPSTTAIDQVFTDNPDLRREAKRGDPVAQFRLGERHYNERRRDPAKDMEALKWFRLSAAQGNADAELRLGYIYYWGRGEAQNYVEAASWYRRAADHGNVHGMTRLASMYRDGKGVPRDREEERKWDNRANEIATRPARQREYKWLAGIMLGVVALASALILLQRARLSGGKRIVVAAFVHVAGIALVLNSLVTYGLPELLFPKCSYGYLAASCSEYQDLGVRHIAEALRNWQTVNLVFRFMALFGFVFDALAVWYVAYLAQPLFRRRQ